MEIRLEGKSCFKEEGYNGKYTDDSGEEYKFMFIDLYNKDHKNDNDWNCVWEKTPDNVEQVEQEILRTFNSRI